MPAGVGAALGDAWLASPDRYVFQPFEPIVQPVPNPAGQVFECRHRQALNIVEIAMVQLTPYRVDHWLDLVEVVGPSKDWVGLPAQRNFYPERMSVQFGVRRGLMGGLKPKLFQRLLYHFTLLAYVPGITPPAANYTVVPVTTQNANTPRFRYNYYFTF